MGFFNAMSSVNKINGLLTEFEQQVLLSQQLLETNASKQTLDCVLNRMAVLHQELIDTFSNSSGARVSMYHMFGDKMRMDGILMYTKNVTMNLAAVITNRYTS